MVVFWGQALSRNKERHSYLVQAVSQVLQLYAVHTVKEGMISLPSEVECNHFHAETT